MNDNCQTADCSAQIAVSIVTPVYNAEKYLRQCIDSIVNQTFKCIELIMVDDGSTDRSVTIIQEYQKKDQRITLLRQNHLFAGAARNNGLSAARGKYVIFLDSDDWFELNMIERLYRVAEESNADIVGFGFRRFDERKKRFSNGPHRAGRRIIKGEECGENLYRLFGRIPWNKFFRREFLMENNIRFLEIRKFEDFYFSLLSVSLAKNSVYYNKAFVNWRTNNSSSLSGQKNANLNCIVSGLTELKSELVKRGLFSGTIQKMYYKQCCDFLFHLDDANDMDSVRELYCAFKENLMPNLFDKKEDFASSVNMTMLYESKSFEEYLFMVNQHRKGFVDRSNPYYRFGRAALYVPSKLVKLFRM